MTKREISITRFIGNPVKAIQGHILRDQASMEDEEGWKMDSLWL